MAMPAKIGDFIKYERPGGALNAKHGLGRYKPATTVRKKVTPKGMMRVRAKQYNLFNFIEMHFGGNVSEAARKIGMHSQQLVHIINSGVYGRVTANRVLDALREIEPGLKLEDIFTPCKFVQIPEKVKPEYPAPILPRMGNVRTVGTSVFSRMLERNT